jgi:hypothetical protein
MRHSQYTLSRFAVHARAAQSVQRVLGRPAFTTHSRILLVGACCLSITAACRRLGGAVPVSRCANN